MIDAIALGLLAFQALALIKVLPMLPMMYRVKDLHTLEAATKAYWIPWGFAAVIPWGLIFIGLTT